MTTIIGGSSPSVTFSDGTTQTTAFTTTPVINSINSQASTPLTLGINGTEAARIDSSGNLLVGTTTLQGQGGWTLYPIGSGGGSLAVWNKASGGGTACNFLTTGTSVGYITYNNTSTTFSTTSDYRLKENIAPMTGALNVVQQLKPVTYDWIADKSKGQGFIAHELQAIVPDCVTGKKDAVDADGKPVYQGIDTSFLVATLTAAIQELNAQVTALTPATPTEAQVNAKQSAMAKLTALGLTEDEVKALIGE
jgi:hypothetical protein